MKTKNNKPSISIHSSNESSQGLIDLVSFILDGIEEESVPIVKQQPIRTSSDTPKKRIQKMRNMGMNTSRASWMFHYKNIPLFIAQAKFMEDFTDTYDDVQFECNRPTYSDMSDEQLRCYFTWRTKVRKGIVNRTSISYVYLYLFELFNNIGVTSCLDAFSKITFIWQSYREIENTLDHHLLDWVKHYYLCNDFLMPFKALVKKFSLEKLYPEVVDEPKKRDLTFTTLERVSDCSHYRSKYLTDQVMPLYQKCFNAIMLNLQSMFDMHGFQLYDMLANQKMQKMTFQPFSGAVYQVEPVKNKQIMISNLESYEHFNGKWFCYRQTGYEASVPAFLGYIMKRIEAQLRILSGYKRPLQTDITELLFAAKLNGSDLAVMIEDGDFIAIIDRTVAECYRYFQQDAAFDVHIVTKPVTQSYAQKKAMIPYVTIREARAVKVNKDPIVKQFSKQASVLAHLEDDFLAPVPFDMVMPSYAKMTTDQIRTYITWRTKYRAGKKPEATLPILSLYANEIILLIGAEDKDDVMRKLVDVLLTYQKTVRGIGTLIPLLIKGYFLCSDFDCTFVDTAKQYHIEPYYPSIFLQLKEPISLYPLYCGLSNYKIWESHFFSAEMEPVIAACFQDTIRHVTQYLKKAKIDLYTLIFSKSTREPYRHPLHYVIYDEKPIPDKVVILSKNESYRCENGVWSCTAMPKNNPIAPYIIGYIMKRMEAKMREIMRFKYKLSPNVSTVLSTMPMHVKKGKKAQRVIGIIEEDGFSETIDAAVVAFFEEKYPTAFTNPKAVFKTPVEVRIDESQLDDIRAKAAENTKRLLVTPIAEGAEYDTRSLSQKDKAQKDTVTVKIMKDTLAGWEGFSTSLSDISVKALQIIFKGQQVSRALHNLAGEAGMMVEVLLETINTNALQYIGDNLIEATSGNVYIYDEYIADVQTMLGRIK